MARAAIRHLMNLIEDPGLPVTKAYRNNRICRTGFCEKSYEEAIMTIREIAAELKHITYCCFLCTHQQTRVRKELREKITKILIQNGYSIKEDAAQDLKKSF